MDSRIHSAILGLGLAGVLALVVRYLSPGRFEAVRRELHQVVEGVPRPVLLAVVLVGTLVLWIATMLFVARLLYWGWRQIDGYVWQLWDLILPESSLVRFAVGVMVMIAVFVLGPMLLIHSLDFSIDDPLERSGDQPANDTGEDVTVDHGSETTSAYSTQRNQKVQQRASQPVQAQFARSTGRSG